MTCNLVESNISKMNRRFSLKNLSKSLCRKIEYTDVFNIPYLRIDDRWVLTASFESEEEIELNDLTNYTWRKFDGEDLKALTKADIDYMREFDDLRSFAHFYTK